MPTLALDARNESVLSDLLFVLRKFATSLSYFWFLKNLKISLDFRLDYNAAKRVPPYGGFSNERFESFHI